MEILVFAVAALVLANKGGPTPPTPPAVQSSTNKPPPVAVPEGGSVSGAIGNCVQMAGVGVAAGPYGALVGCGAGIAYTYRDEIGDGAEWVGDKVADGWNTVKGWFD